MNIDDLVDSINGRRVRITDHADEEAQSDGLLLSAVMSSVSDGEVIEDYPTDRPFPSCLVLSYVGDSEPVHSVWAYNAVNQWSVLITVYRPDPNQWIHWRERK